MLEADKKARVRLLLGSEQSEWEGVGPSYAEVVELLAAMDDVEYDRCRRIKADEWGLRIETLDRLFKQSRRVREYRADEKQPPPDRNDLEARLRPILETEGILDLWTQSWDKVMAGEHRNAKLLYLVATSRLFDDCMHVAIKGPSSAGKSQIRKKVLEFFPPEDIINFTTLSEKALLYFERDFSHRILSMGEASGLQERDLQDTLLRELMSEGVLNYPVAQKDANGKIVTTIIQKNGPVSFLVTTTKAALHPENETRMLSIEVDDSEGQTRRVLAKQAKTIGLNAGPAKTIYHDWQDFQRLLRIVGTRKVCVPFAEALAALIPPRATRLRRDYPQILACIKAHALLHLYLRNNNEKGELVADLKLDYVPVAELIGHIAAEGAGIAISKELLETIDAVKIGTVNIPTDDGATAFEVGKLLKLDKSAARRRLLVATDKGFVVNLEQRRGQPGKYRLTDQEIETASLLPSVEEILAYQATSPERGAKTAPPCHRSHFPDENHNDSGGNDECHRGTGGTTAPPVANGSCHRQETETANEKPTGGTVARKRDPIQGEGDNDPFATTKDPEWGLQP